MPIYTTALAVLIPLLGGKPMNVEIAGAHFLKYFVHV